jgi:uncharacterized protein YjcR
MNAPARRPSRRELLHPPKRIYQMAEEYGVCPSTIWKWRRQAGAKCMTRGENHWSAKLTMDDVRLIRELKASGMRQVDIAEKFEVSQSTVSNIVNFNKWI